MKKYLLFPIALLLVSACAKKETTSDQITLEDTLQQKNGTVLTYQKPLKPLISLKRDQAVYSPEYQNRLQKIAEYYLAKSNQNLVKFHKSKPESNLGYSVEENEWEGVQYTQIGIFTKSGSNMSTLQWLFYEPKSQKLYEFDLNSKKLQEFK